MPAQLLAVLWFAKKWRALLGIPDVGRQVHQEGLTSCARHHKFEVQKHSCTFVAQPLLIDGAEVLMFVI